jgi:hypothetical protein
VTVGCPNWGKSRRFWRQRPIYAHANLILGLLKFYFFLIVGCILIIPVNFIIRDLLPTKIELRQSKMLLAVVAWLLT